MKTQARFEIKAYIKDSVNLNMSGSQPYNELCQIHRTFAMSKNSCQATQEISICLFDMILYVPLSIFPLNRDGSSWVEPVLG